jgi:hypothetical protein
VAYRLHVTVNDGQNAMSRLRLVLEGRGIAVSGLSRTCDGGLTRLDATLRGNAADAGAAVRHLLDKAWVAEVRLGGRGMEYHWTRVTVPAESGASPWAARQVLRVHWHRMHRVVQVRGPQGTVDAAVEALHGRVAQRAIVPRIVAEVESPAPKRGAGTVRWRATRR